MYVLKEPKQLSFDKVGIQGKVFPMQYLTRRSEYVLITTTHGHETTLVEHGSDFIYYVLKGNGYFVINGLKEKCSPGDLVVIPAGTPFVYKGTLTLLLCCTPPWREYQEETL